MCFQDQLSADMYSFVAKEIDYASYFQTVSALTSLKQTKKKKKHTLQISFFCPSLSSW